MSGDSKSQVGDGDDAGFDAVARGVDELVSTAYARMGISSKTGEKPKSLSKLNYNVAFQLTAELDTEWDVVSGFTLEGIMLSLEAQMSSLGDRTYLQRRAISARSLAKRDDDSFHTNYAQRYRPHWGD
jgi:RNAse (barnase) inhibitor barstar